MKKILVVLTILVLVAGSAFAALSGSVEAKYDFDFDKPAAKYSVLGTNAKFTFTFSTESAEVVGEAKPYATATVGLEYGGSVAKFTSKDLLQVATDGTFSYYYPIDGNHAWKFSLSDFRIVGENWELNFLKAIGVGNYAKSAWEIDEDEDNSGVALTAPWDFNDQHGVTFTYDGFSVGIGGEVIEAADAEITVAVKSLTRAQALATEPNKAVAWFAEGDTEFPAAYARLTAVQKAAYAKAKAKVGFGITDEDGLPRRAGVYIMATDVAAVPAASSLNLRAESKEFVFGDNVTAQVAGAIGISKEDAHADVKFDFGVSAKVAYAADDISVSLAADLQKYKSDKVDFDAALNVAVSPVTVDVFYANHLYIPAKHSLFTDETGFFSVRAIVDLSAITSVDMKVYLYGENLFNRDRLLGIEEKATFGKLTEDAQFGIYPGLFEKTSIWFANAEVGYDVAENLNVYAGVGVLDMIGEDAYVLFSAAKVGAKYTHDVFTADGAFYVSKVSGALEEKLLPGFKATVSSDKLVEKAVLSATLLINQNKVVEAYDMTRALDDYTLEGVDTSDWTFNGRNALTLSCKVAF